MAPIAKVGKEILETMKQKSNTKANLVSQINFVESQVWQDVTTMLSHLSEDNYEAVKGHIIEVPMLQANAGTRQLVINLLRSVASDLDYSRFATSRSVTLTLRERRIDSDMKIIDKKVKYHVLPGWFNKPITSFVLTNYLELNHDIRHELPQSWKYIDTLLCNDLLTLIDASSDESLINQIFIAFYKSGRMAVINSVAVHAWEQALKMLYLYSNEYYETVPKNLLLYVEDLDSIPQPSSWEDFIKENYSLVEPMIKKITECDQYDFGPNAKTICKRFVTFSPYYDSVLFSDHNYKAYFVMHFLSFFYFYLLELTKVDLYERGDVITLKISDSEFIIPISNNLLSAEGLSKLLDGQSYKKASKKSTECTEADSQKSETDKVAADVIQEIIDSLE